VEYSKMKSGICFGALASALLAFSIVLGPTQTRADDLDARSCLPLTFMAENSAEVAEAFEVACLSSTSAQTIDAAEVASPSVIKRQAIFIEVSRSVTVAAPGNDIQLWVDDAFLPLAIEGPAILIEVTQSETVVASGRDVAARTTDIANSAPSIAILDRNE
jgi:hypothetical protein